MSRGGGRSWRSRRAHAGEVEAAELALPRRWPWALFAAVAGAAAGAGAAVLAHRSSGGGATVQEPHELRAVVDRPAGGPVR